LVVIDQTSVPSTRPCIAIVTAVFNEEESLPLYERTVREVLLSRTDYKFEV
jgi:hypothetical protein